MCGPWEACLDAIGSLATDANQVELVDLRHSESNYGVTLLYRIEIASDPETLTKLVKGLWMGRGLYVVKSFRGVHYLQREQLMSRGKPALEHTLRPF